MFITSRSGRHSTAIEIVSSPLFGTVPKDPTMIIGANVPLLVFGGVAVLFVVGGLIVLWTLKRRARALQREGVPVPAKPPSPTAPVGFLVHSAVDSKIKPIELYFGKSEVEPNVMISAIKVSDLPQKRNAIDIAGARLSELNPLLQLVPSVLTAAEFDKADYMRVIVNGPLTVSRDAHSFLPFVRGADGKVSELAQLQDRGRLCQIVNTAMVWQFASVIVAQKHLADINKKLDEIKKGIEDILTFLESERVSKITGALRYLDQAIQSIMHGEFDEALRHQLESVERDLISVQDHLSSELRDRTEKIAEIEHSELFGTGDLTQKIKEHQDRIYRVQQQWILCARARAANWQILSAFPGVERLTIIRKGEILKSIEEVIAFHRLLNEKMRNKISEVDSFLNRPETIRERKTTLETRFRQYLDTIMFSAGEIKEQVSRVAADQVVFSQKPIIIALKVEQGRVVEAYELDER